MIGKRPALAVVGAGTDLRALEAVRPVSAEYGFPTAKIKPCIAFLLDGNIGGAERHDAAFVIAIECRSIGLNERETDRVLRVWAKKIGYAQREAVRGIVNAYAKDGQGRYRYYPPGLNKKPGGKYERVLASICADVGCPANCPPFASVHRGPRGQGFDRFEQIGWPGYLRKTRHGAAIDYYRALCLLEQERGFAAGAPILTSYRQLAALADRPHQHAGENLRVLFTRGLLATFERGGGSGPHARDRVASRVQRLVPIPNPPVAYTGAITTGHDS